MFSAKLASHHWWFISRSDWHHSITWFIMNCMCFLINITWFIMNCMYFLINKLQWNQNTKASFWHNEFENICKILSLKSRPLCSGLVQLAVGIRGHYVQVTRSCDKHMSIIFTVKHRWIMNTLPLTSRMDRSIIIIHHHYPWSLNYWVVVEHNKDSQRHNMTNISRWSLNIQSVKIMSPRITWSGQEI